MKHILALVFILAGTALYAQKKRVPERNINEPEREEALTLLAAYDTMKQSVHWPNIHPKEFLDNLKRNIETPLKLNNGRNTNFCAFGAVTYTCLKNEPLRYLKCMLELYQNGKAFYRKVKLDPPDAIKQEAGNLMFQGDLDIYPADQMWFLCLAHRFKGYLNIFNLRYNKGDENTMWAATNLAKFNRMLRRLCKYKVQSRGSDVLRVHSRNMPAFLAEKLSQGEVYLYLNNALVRKKNHNRIKKRMPTHYVVLMEMTDTDNQIMLKYWDGGYKTIKQVSLSSLKQIIYGISWVKYKEANAE